MRKMVVSAGQWRQEEVIHASQCINQSWWRGTDNPSALPSISRLRPYYSLPYGLENECSARRTVIQMKNDQHVILREMGSQEER